MQRLAVVPARRAGTARRVRPLPRPRPRPAEPARDPASLRADHARLPDRHAARRGSPAPATSSSTRRWPTTSTVSTAWPPSRARCSCTSPATRSPPSSAAELPQRDAEERWATANGNLIDLAERVGPARSALVRYEDLVEAPDDVVDACCDDRLGRRLDVRRRPASRPRSVRSLRLDASRPGPAPGPVRPRRGRRARLRRHLAAAGARRATVRSVPPPEAPACPSPPSGPAAPAPVPTPAAEAPPPIAPISRELPLERLVGPGAAAVRRRPAARPGHATTCPPRSGSTVRWTWPPWSRRSARSSAGTRPCAPTSRSSDGRYVQVVGQAGAGVPRLRGSPGGAGRASADAAVEARIAAEVARPFDLQSDLKIRGLLLQTADDVHVLVTTMHHIASDGDVDRHLRHRAGGALRGVGARRGARPSPPLADAVRRLRRLAARPL